LLYRIYKELVVEYHRGLVFGLVFSSRLVYRANDAGGASSTDR